MNEAGNTIASWLLRACAAAALTATVMFAAPRASAQAQNTGSVGGNVTDQQGGIVPGADITLTDAAVGRTVKTRSSAKGEYLFSDVPIGHYRLRVVAPTFQAFVVNDIEVNADANVRTDAKLVPGNVQAEVTVEAQGTSIDTRSATIGTMIDQNLVENLPIDGENIVSLAALLPGVTDVNAPTTFTSDTSGPTYSVSGSRSNQNLFLLDGLIWNNSFYNTGLNYPPRYATEEVSVLLNNYKAQYGRNSGSIFNVLTRKGGNGVHGTVWEYYQNSALDAGDYFSGVITHGAPFLIANQYGATIGGPIKKDKLFYFLSYQGIRLDGDLVASSQPPTLQELGFDAPGVPHPCKTAAFAGKQCASYYQDFLIPIYNATPCGSTPNASTLPSGCTNEYKSVKNPLYTDGTTAASSLQTAWLLGGHTGIAPCITDMTNYPNYPGVANPSGGSADSLSTLQEYLPYPELPVECFNPVAQTFVSRYLGLPNATAGGAPVWYSKARQPRNDQNGLARGDWTINAQHSLDARFYVTNVNDITSNSVSQGVGVASYGQDLNVAGIYAGSVGETWVITPNVLNVLRAGYKRYSYFILPCDHTTLADMGASYTQPGPAFSPELEATNRFTVGSPNSSQSTTVTSNYEVDEALTWTHGTHNFMFGGQYIYSDYLHRFYQEPQFEAEQQNTNVTVGDFMLGLLYSETVGNLTNLAATQPAAYFYAQDDWRATRKLTLNYGLRYELPFSWQETDGQGTTFIPGYQSQVYPQAPAGVAYQGDPGIASTAPPTRYDDLAPRVGFSYDVFGNGSLAVRGGFGIFYDTLNANLVGIGEPFHYSAFYSQPAGGLSQPLQGLPAIPNDYIKGQSTPQFVLPYTINFADRNLRNPYTEAVNFGFQQKIRRSGTLEMDYVGKFGRHQIVPIDQNPAIYDCSGSFYQSNPALYCPSSSVATTDASYEARVLYPGFNYGGQGVVDNESVANSNYNGLQVIYSQRAAKGINVYTSYTYSRSIDISSNGATNTAHIPQPHHLNLEYAASDFNATHILNLGWIWRLPTVTSSSRFVSAVMNDWTWGGIYNARTGNPVNVTISGDASYTDQRTQRPVQIGNPNLPANRHRAQKVAEYFNLSAFAQPADGTFSNLRRNSLKGPGYINTDMNVSKGFNTPWEGKRIQLRLEGYNVFNTPNLANPQASRANSVSNATANTFAVIRSTVGTNNAYGSNGRRVQISFIFTY